MGFKIISEGKVIEIGSSMQPIILQEYDQTIDGCD